MSCTETNQPSKGPSAALIASIDHLSNLLKNLPQDLPLPETANDAKYQFYLDEDDVKKEGLYYALNRRLEVCFQTHQQPTILFEERGNHMKNLIGMLKRVVKGEPGQREFIEKHWVERLTEAAKASGAKIPDKR
jgi:hypothetical protein